RPLLRSHRRSPSSVRIAAAALALPARQAGVVTVIDGDGQPSLTPQLKVDSSPARQWRHWPRSRRRRLTRDGEGAVGAKSAQTARRMTGVAGSQPVRLDAHLN